MKAYRVVWEIDIDASSPREAAQKALEIQRDRDSMALVFSVKEFGSDEDATFFDLLDEEE